METVNKDINLLGASGRAKGVANFAVNFEPGGQSPLDARLLVKTKEDLINPETYSAKNYYKGMTVTIESDGTEYVLMDISKITSEDYSGWKQRDPMDTLESLPSTLITDLTNVTVTTNTAVIHSSKVTKTNRTYGNAADDNITIPAATSSVAGIMTAADKVKLDTTLPNQISTEISRATAREEELDNKIDSSKGTMDNYTVNGIKISTNPVITGANAKVTGYSKPSSTSAIAATDSINAALGKLEKKADDHIANKSNPHQVTKAQVGLGNCDNTSDLNKPISTATQTALNSKVQTVEVTGTGNAITAASISGTKLTLTKGATYNNQTYTAGTNLGLSGNTFSLNSTISLTRVNASSGFFQTSDKRLKSEIKPLDHSLEDICSIPTDSFILNGKSDFGTIAQEVEDKFPELVSEARLKESDVDEPSKFDKVEINGESYVLVKEVDYSKLSILAIEGIKLLKKEIEELKKQLNK